MNVQRNRRVLWQLYDAVMDPTRLPGCSRCGETEFSPNVEAFELSGEPVCDECADEVFGENGQFGAGA